MQLFFRPICIALCLLLAGGGLYAQTIRGTVTERSGKVLGSASIYLKGTTKGTTSNREGNYALPAAPGEYVLVCAYVGYRTLERTITIGAENQRQDFVLEPQTTELDEVVVKAGGEDPAYEIMRQTIARRGVHLQETSQYSATVYTKGLIKTRALPRRVMGVKVDANRDIVDSTGRGIVYLSESLAKYYTMPPDKYREEVVSAKVSGNSQGFGFNSPRDLELNIYQNNLDFGGINARGFISPVAQNAFNFYRYKYLGSFREGDREILKIQVIPKRRYEPVFTGGYLQIIDGEWRVHSLSLLLTKASQLEFVDSLQVQQQYFPVGYAGIWMPQSIRFLASFGVLGIKGDADFSGVFADYDVKTDLAPVFKGRVVKTIDTSANKRSEQYWESIRPLPLTLDERADYLRKELLEAKFNSKAYLDSLDKRRNRFGVSKFFLTGHTILRRYKKLVYDLPPVIRVVMYNTVEGWAAELAPTVRHYADTGAWSFSPKLRYGFNNTHWNAMATFSKSMGQSFYKRWRLTASGGKYTFQINPSNPIDPLINSFSTLIYTSNFLKIYEKAFGSIGASRRIHGGLTVGATLSYEDRIPLNNTDTTYQWNQFKERRFTSNYPEELPPGNFERHQALLTKVSVRWQPGHTYVQYPDRRVSQGSDKPVFTLELEKAWSGILGADANFGKWRLAMEDDVNLKLAGELRYRLQTGGFINNRNVQLPDWQHFTGNQTIAAGPYLESFQLAPYYANSTKDRFFAAGNLEWHLNGLITNKIPLFRKLNWNLVAGSNAFFVDADRHYLEFFVGLENIFKIFRVDWVSGYDAATNNTRSRIVIGVGGLFGR